MAGFEDQLSRRLEIGREVDKGPTCEKSQVADLAGLAVHSSPPRINRENDSDLLLSLGRDSPQHGYRPKINAGVQLPFSILIHKPVNRKDYLDDPLAMEA